MSEKAGLPKPWRRTTEIPANVTRKTDNPKIDRQFEQNDKALETQAKSLDNTKTKVDGSGFIHGHAPEFPDGTTAAKRNPYIDLLAGGVVTFAHGFKTHPFWIVTRCEQSVPALVDTTATLPAQDQNTKLQLTHTGAATTRVYLWVWV